MHKWFSAEAPVRRKSSAVLAGALGALLIAGVSARSQGCVPKTLSELMP
jgi:hypothetical protein